MKSLKTENFVVILLLSFMLLTLMMTWGCRDVSRFLVLEEYGSGRIIMLFPLGNAQKVVVRYQHSVMDVPVYQVLNVSQPGPPILKEVITKERLTSFPGYEEKAYRQIEPPAMEGIDSGSRTMGIDPWILIGDLHTELSMPWLVKGSIVDRTLFINGQVMHLSEIKNEDSTFILPMIRLLPATQDLIHNAGWQEK